MASETQTSPLSSLIPSRSDWIMIGGFVGIAAFMMTQFDTLEDRVTETRAELRAHIAETRTETRVDIDALDARITETRAELRADIAALDARITETRAELRADIAAVGLRVSAVQDRIGDFQQRMAHQEALLSVVQLPRRLPDPEPDTDAPEQ